MSVSVAAAASPSRAVRSAGPAAALATTIVLWASAFAGIRVALRSFSPEQLSILRLGVASVVLGAIQIAISVSVNAMIALAAGSIALFLGSRPSWMLVQRWLMGTVLAGLAVRMAVEAKKV